MGYLIEINSTDIKGYPIKWRMDNKMNYPCKIFEEIYKKSWYNKYDDRSISLLAQWSETLICWENDEK